ncbi:promotilin-like [Spea bombifrons]|uniref:promotilin-like n=1 Tax=Spea bombifrons TaxID=233779 RepID=UPI002349A1C1|nr:promotilin-like [Spea bombifrons]
MDSRTAISTLLIIYGLCMLAEKSQGSFAHFYSHSDACNMQQREKSRACKKFMQRSERGDLREEGGLQEKDVLKMSAPLEIELKIDSQQMENYQDIIEDIFNEDVEKL